MTLRSENQTKKYCCTIMNCVIIPLTGIITIFFKGVFSDEVTKNL